MHGNPLVIVSCYLPHDAVLQHTYSQPRRTAAREELHDTINKVTEAKNLIVCGDFNAAVHHRKADEEDIIGQRVFEKGRLFRATKEDRMPDNFVDHRGHSITLARATSTVVANTFIQKNPENKITYKAMTTDTGPPWTPERYCEIGHCLVRKCWRSSVLDITTDQHTNIIIDHYMMTARIRQVRFQIKAKDDLKIDSIPEGNEEDILRSLNCSISEQLTKSSTEEQRETTMVDPCDAMDKAARNTLQFKEPLRKRASCHPELLLPIETRHQATRKYDCEGVKAFTK